MNKKLVALAVAGACALPLTAQAQTANVTLYGRLNLDAEVIINQRQNLPGGPTGNYYRVDSNSSRLGVRGDENLGGGLHAIFQAEERFDASNAGVVSLAGDTYAGLQGGWGTMKIGYFLTPYDDIGSITGSVPTLITGILGTSAIWSNTGYPGNAIDTGAFDDRAANSIEYTTPNMKGFVASFLVAGRDTGGTDGGGGNGVTGGGDVSQQRRHASVFSVDGLYTNGPFTAGIAYEQHNKLRPGTAQTVACPTCETGLKDEGVTAALAYQWGPVKLSAIYEQLRYDVNLVGAGGLGTGGQLKDNHWGVSMTANWGPGQFYAAWYGAANGRFGGKCLDAHGVPTDCGGATAVTGPRVGAVTGGSNTASNMWELSYTYPLSKRTLLYAGYVDIVNKSNAGYNFHVNQIAGVCTGNGDATGCGAADKPQGLALGIVEFW